MTTQTSFTVNQQMISIKEKLKTVSKKNTIYFGNISQTILDNTKYNLTSLIAHIILELTYQDKSKNTFQDCINQYNTENKTDLHFNDFEQIHWIRIIDNRVIIPEMVRWAAWKIIDDIKNISDIPDDKKDIALCLANYYKEYYSESRPTIKNDILKGILYIINQDKEAIDYLIKKKFLEYCKEKDIYYWNNDISYYNYPLNNEICTILWHLAKNKYGPELSFKKYFIFLEGSGIFPDNIHSVVSENDSTMIYMQAMEILQNEDDLKNSSYEFIKLYLDSKHFGHDSLKDPIPNVILKFDNIYNFPEELAETSSLFRFDFHLQGVRNFCYRLLKIIILYELKYEKKINIIKILKDTTRPCLVFMIQDIIARWFPEIIPFLLEDLELAPIALKLIDKVEFNTQLLSGNTGDIQNSEKTYMIKNELWLDVFDIAIAQVSENFISTVSSSSKSKCDDMGVVIVEMLSLLSRQLFSNISVNNQIVHNVIQERYNKALKKLCGIKSRNTIFINGISIKPRLYYSFLPSMLVYLDHIIKNINFNDQYLSFKSDIFDLCNEIIYIANIPNDNQETTLDQRENINKSVEMLTISLLDYLNRYFLIEELVVESYYDIQKKTVKRGFDENIIFINWGYFYLLLHRNNLIKKFKDDFNKSILVNANINDINYKYEEQNKNQYYKIRFFLKTLLLSYIELTKTKNHHQILNRHDENILTEIESMIFEYAIKYSTNNLYKKSLDVFDESFVIFHNIAYYEKLASTLFYAINHFHVDKQKIFFERFFSKSLNIKRMLSAINTVRLRSVKNVISNQIEKINIEDFIETCFTVTDWEETLLEAINSENHWQFANPLIKKIREHYKKQKIKDNNVEFLLFQCDLSLALRENNLEKITKSTFVSSAPFINNELPINEKKDLYIAKYHINNGKFDLAINLLRSLVENNTKNIQYAIQLYHAHILKAICVTNEMEKNIIDNAFREWRLFLEGLGDKRDKIISENYDAIAVNDIYYYIINKEKKEVYRILNSLSEQFLFNENILKIVFDFYISQDEYSLALDYINNAKNYYQMAEYKSPEILEKILSDNKDLTGKIQINLSSLINSNYKVVPLIIPGIINDKRELNLFILKEIIDAVKQLQKKIHAVESIPHENKYTDLIQILLFRRFPFFNWSVSDQPRTGSSNNNNDAGEADLIIQSGGTDIALIEALISKNRKYIEEHILRCFKYDRNLERYYILVYYKNESSNFESFWDSYKNYVCQIKFPSEIRFENPSSPFVDLRNEFPDSRGFYIAKTNLFFRDLKVEMFHLMVDFSFGINQEI